MSKKGKAIVRLIGGLLKDLFSLLAIITFVGCGFWVISSFIVYINSGYFGLNILTILLIGLILMYAEFSMFGDLNDVEVDKKQFKFMLIGVAGLVALIWIILLRDLFMYYEKAIVLSLCFVLAGLFYVYSLRSMQRIDKYRRELN